MNWNEKVKASDTYIATNVEKQFLLTPEELGPRQKARMKRETKSLKNAKNI